MADKGFKRKLTAILSADAVDYSRLIGDDDNLLAEFVSVVDAVQCAVAIQKEIKARNDELPETRRMQFRIGINLGDVIQEEDRIYGDGVNIAARLEGLSDPGGCHSGGRSDLW